jgi:hypothetical protein
VAAVLALGTFLVGGSTSGPSSTSAAVRATCQQVAAVLSDGPDPVADPVGYAEAQILPLRRIHSPDHRLQAAIDDLATAYQHFFDAAGSGSSGQAVKGANHELDGLCPALAS